MGTHTIAAFPLQVQPVASATGGRPAEPVNAEALARRAAGEFESVFLSTMLRPIFEELAEHATLAGGEAERTWSGLLAEQYAGEIAGSGGIGVAETVFRELLSLQEEGQS